MSGWRDRLPGAQIRDEIRWLGNRVAWTEEAAAEEQWLREQNASALDRLEQQVMEVAGRVLAERRGR